MKHNRRKTRRRRKGGAKLTTYPSNLSTLTNIEQRTLNYLKLTCGQSHECLSFGADQIPLIINFFDFVSFKYAKDPIKLIGVPSLNGFVNEIEYSRGEYVAFAILKSSRGTHASKTHQNYISDNLVYDYLVGTRCINKLIYKFPCFLETYGLFCHYDATVYQNLQTHTTPPTTGTLKKGIRLLNSYIHKQYKKALEFACNYHSNIAVLMQHVHNATTLDDVLLTNIENPEFVKYDLPILLFQVYGILGGELSRQFTHYDLHCGNILLYDLGVGRYVKMNYVLEDGTTISFQTQYIVKIIDYGRAAFAMDTSSFQIYTDICSITTDCGNSCGFSHMHTHINRSKDLMAAAIVGQYLNDVAHKLPDKNDLVLKKIKMIFQNVNMYYKPHDPERFSLHANMIFNIIDLKRELTKFLRMEKFVMEYASYVSSLVESNNIIGEMNIWVDMSRDMVYTPRVENFADVRVTQRASLVSTVPQRNDLLEKTIALADKMQLGRNIDLFPSPQGSQPIEYRAWLIMILFKYHETFNYSAVIDYRFYVAPFRTIVIMDAMAVLVKMNFQEMHACVFAIYFLVIHHTLKPDELVYSHSLSNNEINDMMKKVKDALPVDQFPSYMQYVSFWDFVQYSRHPLLESGQTNFKIYVGYAMYTVLCANAAMYAPYIVWRAMEAFIAFKTGGEVVTDFTVGKNDYSLNVQACYNDLVAFMPIYNSKSMQLHLGGYFKNIPAAALV